MPSGRRASGPLKSANVAALALPQWLLPQYQEDWFIARAVVRYRRFLHLQTLYPTLLLEPPLDVALICLAHQVQRAATGRTILSAPHAMRLAQAMVAESGVSEPARPSGQLRSIGPDLMLPNHDAADQTEHEFAHPDLLVLPYPMLDPVCTHETADMFDVTRRCAATCVEGPATCKGHTLSATDLTVVLPWQSCHTAFMVDMAAIFGKAAMAQQQVLGKTPFQVTQVRQSLLV